MDPISSVSAIFAALRVTTASRNRVREYIAESRAPPEILGQFQDELATIASLLTQLGVYFQDHAGSLGNKTMQQASSAIGQLNQAMAEIIEMLSVMSIRSNPPSIIQRQRYGKEMETRLQHLQSVKLTLGVLSQAIMPKQREELNELDRLIQDLQSKARCPDHEAAEKLRHEENMVADFTARLRLHERLSFNKLNFLADQVSTLKVCHIRTATVSETMPEKPEEHGDGMFKIETLSTTEAIDEQWLGELTTGRTAQLYETSTAQSMYKSTLRLIICASTSATLNCLPFSRVTFVRLMTQMNLPGCFLHLLLKGTSNFTKRETKGSDVDRVAFVFRTPLAVTEDWTLTLCWDKKNLTINGILHGADEEERLTFLDHIKDARDDTCHPMLLPLILCEMLTESDSNHIKLNAMELTRIEMLTNVSGLHESDDLKIKPEASASPTPEMDFAVWTQKLNYVILRFAFHEMRMQANAVLADQIKAYMDLTHVHHETDTSPLSSQSKPAEEIEDQRSTSSRIALLESATRLRARIDHLEAEQRALLLEVSCNTKIAASQLQIVYSLIAQRDNKNNLRMAAISTTIADTTKEDSFAMRTLAVMSVLFLPGTFIASFFSMNMFNWQAAEGEKIVTSRFWIYWAVTIPFTLIILGIWLWWVHLHKHAENEPIADKIAAISGESMKLEKIMHEKSNYVQLTALWRSISRSSPKAKLGSEEENVACSESLSSDMAKTTSMAQPKRSDTTVRERSALVQGPRR